MKKDCWLWKKNKGQAHQENLQEVNVADIVVQNDLTLSLDNINDACVIDFRAYFPDIPHVFG